MVEVKTIHEIINEVSPYYKKQKKPEAVHDLVYDSSSETLEPVYFFILDLMNDMAFTTEKIADNFGSSPGSGHFGELTQRLSIMQQQGGKLLGDINVVLKSILNIIYDLRDFKMRLQVYDDLKDNEKKEAALLSLKQIWLDKVDVQRGQGSIHGMTTGQLGFVTLRDSFLFAKDVKAAKELDLNERVKRIILARIEEFNIWLKMSEAELRKRFSLERTYLRSQVNSLKIYSRWAKPYLKAAQDLETKDFGRNPSMVKAFNTLLLELTLFGYKEFDVTGAVKAFDMPKLSKIKRKYNTCVIVEFNFRGIPQKAGQQFHYVFGGKANVKFSAYTLNEDEIKKIKEKLDKSDYEDILGLIEGATTESLGQLKKDIDEFLEEDNERKEEKKKMNLKDTFEPFSALFGAYSEPEEKKENRKEEKKKQKGIFEFFGFKDKEKDEVEPDSFVEKEYLRKLSAEESAKQAFAVFDVYKKAHGMESFPGA